MKWVPAEQYTVKIEGVELAGYRALTLCGTRDPLLIGRFDDWIETVRQEVETKAANLGVEPSEYEPMSHVYGRVGVVDESALTIAHHPQHLGLRARVVAQSPQ